jgi:hypothetical protein
VHILSLEHCKRAISDVATFGDNDVVPFDVDTKFVAECADQLADALLDVGHRLERKTTKDCKSTLHGVQIFSERLLAPVGQSGFRITTKIHPFWNLYLNSIAVALAELHEPQRLEEAHSYRFSATGPGIFLILTVFVAVYCIDNKYYLLLVAGIYPDKTSIPYLYHKF